MQCFQDQMTTTLNEFDLQLQTAVNTHSDCFSGSVTLGRLQEVPFDTYLRYDAVPALQAGAASYDAMHFAHLSLHTPSPACHSGRLALVQTGSGFAGSAETTESGLIELTGATVMHELGRYVTGELFYVVADATHTYTFPTLEHILQRGYRPKRLDEETSRTTDIYPEEWDGVTQGMFDFVRQTLSKNRPRVLPVKN